MDLIKEIALHKEKNSPKICFMLMNLIDRLNLDTLEKLKEYEDDSFTPAVTGVRATDEEIVNQMFEEFVADRTHFDYLSVQDESELVDLYNAFKKTTDLDEKFIIDIKIYSILDWGVAVPFHAYKYIMEDRLN